MNANDASHGPSGGALCGLSVLDFGSFIAGPYSSALLGDLGADVVRVEQPGGGDDRSVTPLGVDDAGALFVQANRNKRSLTLDLATPSGKAIAHRLVAEADVVVANLPDRVLAKLGLDYPSLKRVRADVILGTVNAYGSHPDYAHKSGFDGVGQALSGAAFLSGDGSRPIKSYVPWVDFTTASLLANGLLAALYVREKTGMGQHVRASLLETALSVTASVLAEYEATGLERQPSGNQGQTYAPSDIFESSDGWFILQVVGTRGFEAWADVVGRPDLKADPRFADDSSRGRNREILNSVMAGWASVRTSGEILSILDRARLPAAAVLSPSQALADAQVESTEMFEHVSYPGVENPIPIARTPFSMSATPGSIRSGPPRAGEHTNEILGLLGYDELQIAAFRNAGVI